MKARLARGLVVLGLVVAAALASPARGQNARTGTQKQQLQINLAWQVALDGANFSPGIIDGNFGRKGQMALKEYAEANFPGVDPLDPKVYEALKVDVEHAVATYTIGDADAAEVGVLPDDWNEKAKLDKLPYESLLDALAEKFHCTKLLLQRLNPDVNMATLNVGQVVRVPNLRPFPEPGGLEKMYKPRSGATGAAEGRPAAVAVNYLSINLTEKTIRAYDKQDRQVALFHCSVARDKAKLPARDTVVKTMASPPEYTFFPAMWPEVHNVNTVLTIKPGPRNPVGLAWMGLDLPGYGIHGNPKPELIGKTGSHGCFRLTNWDALNLFSMARIGMKVKIVNPEREGAGEETAGD